MVWLQALKQDMTIGLKTVECFFKINGKPKKSSVSRLKVEKVQLSFFCGFIFNRYVQKQDKYEDTTRRKCIG